jgi:hypothetical protein
MKSRQEEQAAKLNEEFMSELSIVNDIFLCISDLVFTISFYSQDISFI